MMEAFVKELQQQKKRVLRQIDGLRTQANKISDAIKVLSKLSEPVAAVTKPAKRKMSAAGRRAIAAAARARWAKVKTGKTAATKPAKKKGPSAAGIAKIRAAQKARWAKIKAEKLQAAQQ